jgi:hypothetical protein
MGAQSAESPFALLPCAALAASALLLGGCATVAGTPMQAVSIQALDAFDRPVDGMRCRIVNNAADYFGTTPIFDLQVRRSSSDLEIECRRGSLLARGTAVSRGMMLASVLLPGGTAALIIDHLSGYRYSYPTRLQLRIGEHLVFDDDATPPTRLSSGAIALH